MSDATFVMPPTNHGSEKHSSSPNKFVYYARKIYNPLGFHKGYNFPLFVITCGAMMGFALARFQYFNINGNFLPNTIAGEQYWYRGGFRRTAIIMHLATILPAVFLVSFQFVPIIRYKALIFHRINGYVVTILLLISNAGVFMLARHAVGGDMMLQAWVGILGTISTAGALIAYINIKMLQIDQHRAWMLRTWAWTASIISLRIIFIAANSITVRWYTYWVSIRCAEIWYMYTYYAGVPDSANPTRLKYPQCTGPDSNVFVSVSTRPTGTPGPENISALQRTTFGMSGLVALTIHLILMELYLALTPAESYRLRVVSHERQVKAGLRLANKGAITASRFGDAPSWWNRPIGGEAYAKQPNASDSDVPHDQEATKVGVDASRGPAVA